MGTNYYYEYNICDCCHRADSLHIGKSAGGWAFLFRAHDEVWVTERLSIKIESWRDWLDFFSRHRGKITNQYDDVLELSDFIAMVNWKNSGRKGSADYIDSDGFGFTFNEFS